MKYIIILLYKILNIIYYSVYVNIKNIDKKRYIHTRVIYSNLIFLECKILWFFLDSIKLKYRTINIFDDLF